MKSFFLLALLLAAVTLQVTVAEPRSVANVHGAAPLPTHYSSLVNSDEYVDAETKGDETDAPAAKPAAPAAAAAAAPGAAPAAAPAAKAAAPAAGAKPDAKDAKKAAKKDDKKDGKKDGKKAGKKDGKKDGKKAGKKGAKKGAKKGDAGDKCKTLDVDCWAAKKAGYNDDVQRHTRDAKMSILDSTEKVEEMTLSLNNNSFKIKRFCEQDPVGAKCNTFTKKGNQLVKKISKKTKLDNSIANNHLAQLKKALKQLSKATKGLIKAQTLKD